VTTGDEARPTARRREQLTELARRSKEVILLSALVGTITGFAVAAFGNDTGTCGAELLRRHNPQLGYPGLR